MNKKFILIIIFLVSCTFSDDTSLKNPTKETTVITTADGIRSTNYLDYREIKLLRGLETDRYRTWKIKSK